MGILNAIGRAGKTFYKSGALPEMLRAGIVAAGSPTRGAVGTAGDIFGALGAVEDDRLRRQEIARQREMQQLALERQAKEDVRSEQLNNARVEEYKTRADYNKRRGTPGQGRQSSPSKVDLIKQQIALAEDTLNRKLSEREVQTLIGTHGPQYDMRSDEAYWANAMSNAQTDEERNGIRAAREAATKSLATAKSAGTAEGKAPFMRPFAFQTDSGAKLVRPSFLGGKMSGVEEQNVTFSPRKAAPRQETASDKRLTREETIGSIVNRVLKEDSSGSPANALRNVQQFYQDDPEVQQYKAEVMARLQKLVKGQATSKKDEQSIDLLDRAKERKQKKTAPTPAAVEVWTRDAGGNLVRAK